MSIFRLAATLLLTVGSAACLHCSEPVVRYAVGDKFFFRAYWHFHGGHSGTWDFFQEAVGETVIDGKVYTRFSRSRDFRSSQAFFSQSITPWDTGTVFLERADTTALFQYDLSSQGDFLLADFRDTMYHLYPQFGSNAYVASTLEKTILGETVHTMSVFSVVPWVGESSLYCTWEYASGFGPVRYIYSAGGPGAGVAELTGAVRNAVAVGETWTDVQADRSPLSPAAGGAVDVYPNPFNPSTRIRLTIVYRLLTTVNVYDLLGREVAALLNEVKDPGTFAIPFDASGFPAGVYFCRVRSGDFVETRRFVLLR